MGTIYCIHKLVGLQLFGVGLPLFSSGTPTFCQMGVLNSCFQNPSESSISRYTDMIECSHYNTPGSVNFEFFGGKSFGCVFDLMRSALNSLGIDHRRRKTIHGNSSGKKFFRASQHVLYLQYWVLCDALVVLKL